MKTITIYTAPNCPFSKRLKNFLYKKGLPFSEILLTKNSNPSQILETPSIWRTPIVSIASDGIKKNFIGFNTEVKEFLSAITI